MNVYLKRHFNESPKAISTAMNTITFEVVSSAIAGAVSAEKKLLNDSKIFEITVRAITNIVSLGVHVVVHRAKNIITGQVSNIVEEFLVESYAS